MRRSLLPLLKHPASHDAARQIRANQPNYFGVGYALQHFILHNDPDAARGSATAKKPKNAAVQAANLALLQTMAHDFPLFLDIIRNVEIALAKADFAIARLYADLVEDKALRDRVFTTLHDEFELTRRMILAVTRQTSVLQTNPVLDRSIRLRNPYLDPMSLIQVEMIRRKRAAVASGQPVPPELDRAITATINGISAGLRNTG